MDPNKREIERLAQIVDQINALEAEFEKLSDDALRAKTDEFRAYIRTAVEGIEDEKERYQAEQTALNEICHKPLPPCARLPSAPLVCAITMCS